MAKSKPEQGLDLAAEEPEVEVPGPSHSTEIGPDRQYPRF